MKPDRIQNINVCPASSLMPVRACCGSADTLLLPAGRQSKHRVHHSILFSWHSNTHSNAVCGGNPLGSTSNGSYPAITTQVLSGAHQHKNFGSQEKRKAVIFLKQKTQESGMALMYLMKPAPVWLACNCSSKGSAERAKLPDFAALFHRTYDFQSEVAFLPSLMDSFLKELRNLPTFHICLSY